MVATLGALRPCASWSPSAATPCCTAANDPTRHPSSTRSPRPRGPSRSWPASTSWCSCTATARRSACSRWRAPPTSRLSRPYPLGDLVAETQGLIGYWLQQAIGRHLTSPGGHPGDPDRRRPRRPCLRRPDQVRRLGLRRARGPGTRGRARLDLRARRRGWRRVVASPAPVRVVETATADLLLESGVTVVLAGGGGIPVVERAAWSGRGRGRRRQGPRRRPGRRELGADLLVVLTDVSAVMAPGWAGLVHDFASGRSTSRSRLSCCGAAACPSSRRRDQRLRPRSPAGAGAGRVGPRGRARTRPETRASTGRDPAVARGPSHGSRPASSRRWRPSRPRDASRSPSCGRSSRAPRSVTSSTSCAGSRSSRRPPRASSSTTSSARPSPPICGSATRALRRVSAPLVVVLEAPARAPSPDVSGMSPRISSTSSRIPSCAPPAFLQGPVNTPSSRPSRPTAPPSGRSSRHTRNREPRGCSAIGGRGNRAPSTSPAGRTGA